MKVKSWTQLPPAQPPWRPRVLEIVIESHEEELAWKRMTGWNGSIADLMKKNGDPLDRADFICEALHKIYLELYNAPAEKN